MRHAPARSRPARLALGLASLGLVAASAVAVAPPVAAGQGTGESILEVSHPSVPADGVVTVTVTGTDYLVPPHAPGNDVFGGVYVFFGWVSDPVRFGPSIRTANSTDGNFGFTYVYPGEGGDASTRDEGDAGGLMRLVSFTAGGESGESASTHMDRDGNWSTQMELRGSRFTYTVPGTGESRTVDCQQTQCGIYTIGAHGKTSATNERFVPLTFTGTADQAPIDVPPPADPPPEAPPEPEDVSPEEAEPAAVEPEEAEPITSTSSVVSEDAASEATDDGGSGGGNGVLVGAVGLGAVAGLGSGVVLYRRRLAPS